MTTTALIRPTGCGRRAAASADQRAGQIVSGGPAARYQRSHRQPVGVSPAISAPNYVARRLVAAVVAVASIVGLAAASTSIVAGFGGAPASAAEVPPHLADGAERAPAHHVAQPGDTLWSIASEYRGSVEHGRYVDALIRLNGGTAIDVGQAVRLP